MMGNNGKVLWTGKLLPGKKEEYIERHNNIWPEMAADLKAQGIYNYSIFNAGDEVIGYYECDDLDRLRKIKAASTVAKRWTESMQGIVEFPKEPDGVTNKIYEQIFYLN